MLKLIEERRRSRRASGRDPVLTVHEGRVMFTEQMKLVHRMVRVAFTHEMAGFALEIATGLCIAGLDDATCVRRVENGLRDRAFSHEMSLKKEK